MRISILLAALLPLIPAAHADSVRGFCEREGKRLEFTDGLAFADARDEQGRITTTIYFTAKKLDRAALAKCADCAAKLPENTFMSPRGDLIEAQRQATAPGWMEIQHVGGDIDITTIVNIMYLAGDGVLTGLDDGRSRVEFATRDDKRVAGKVVKASIDGVPEESPMTCDIAFDLAVGWPK